MSVTALTAAMLACVVPIDGALDIEPEFAPSGFVLAAGMTPGEGAAMPADAPPVEDIIVTARPVPIPGDPLEKINARAFEATQAVDKALFGPAAVAYREVLPVPVRSGLRNLLGNLREPVVFVNYLLQFKPGKAIETVARFAINSTVGIAGLVDVAKRKPFRLPRRANGFADTLGYYGVKAGPFFFLPLLGPTTLRDLFGDTIDRLLLPLAVGRPFSRLAYTLPATVIGALDRRAEVDERLQTIRTEARDPYATVRDIYLKRRQAEIDGLHRRSRLVPAG